MNEALQHSTREGILYFLKRNGESEAKVIARHCGLSAMAVSRHLAGLRAEQLIAARIERRPRGRPTSIYALTALGDAHFPRDYAGLARDLLASLKVLDGEQKVRQVLRKRRQRMTAQYLPQLRGKGLAARVRETASILTDCGYMAEVEAQGDRSFVLTEYNCAVRGVAECFPAVCEEELRFLRTLVDGEVKRVSHVLGGDCNCSYAVRARAARTRPRGGSRETTKKRRPRSR